jgi:altronate dehydratase
MAKTDLLAHHKGDAVAVAVKDLDPGTSSVGYLDESPQATVDVIGHIPLGHKVALQDLAGGTEVVEYGTVIGRTTADIRTGEHVHVHNVKGERWV